MTVNKKYSNYSEQVKDNVIIKDLRNDLSEIDEVWFEQLYEAIDIGTSNERVLSSVNEYVVDVANIKEESEEMYELRDEYIRDMFDGVYQMYEVELIGGKFTPEHERLCIFYNDELEAYILPVFHFGTSWDYISPMN